MVIQRSGIYMYKIVYFCTIFSIHPSRRDSSGSDASMRGSVASLPGDVPFRGTHSQGQVTRREKVERDNQQRPRSLYDSTSEAGKDFSSIAEPGRCSLHRAMII